MFTSFPWVNNAFSCFRKSRTIFLKNQGTISDREKWSRCFQTSSDSNQTNSCLQESNIIYLQKNSQCAAYPRGTPTSVAVSLDVLEKYMKYYTSWKNILAMPQNLLSFCISPPYNVLPFPSNLKHWKVDKEPSCPLRRKQLCTIAHILGASNISLQQGHFSFRYYFMLNALISVLTIFLT